MPYTLIDTPTDIDIISSQEPNSPHYYKGRPYKYSRDMPVDKFMAITNRTGTTRHIAQLDVYYEEDI